MENNHREKKYGQHEEILNLLGRKCVTDDGMISSHIGAGSFFNSWMIINCSWALSVNYLSLYWSVALWGVCSWHTVFVLRDKARTVLIDREYDIQSLDTPLRLKSW